jgi:alkylated DNA repair dioxygenase AlkB
MITKTILPCDGEAYYHPNWLSTADANRYFQSFIDASFWANEKIILFGKELKLARKVAWFADEQISYRYAGQVKTNMTWTDDVLNLRNRLHSELKVRFNGCLMNLYHDGKEYMGWHSDNEPDICTGSTIAAISLGAKRTFSFKHKTTKETISLELEHGSLLLMCGTIQENWLHALPKRKRVTNPRINLTFRQMKEDNELAFAR